MWKIKWQAKEICVCVCVSVKWLRRSASWSPPQAPAESPWPLFWNLCTRASTYEIIAKNIFFDVETREFRWKLGFFCSNASISAELAPLPAISLSIVAIFFWRSSMCLKQNKKFKFWLTKLFATILDEIFLKNDLEGKNSNFVLMIQYDHI